MKKKIINGVRGKARPFNIKNSYIVICAFGDKGCISLRKSRIGFLISDHTYFEVNCSSFLKFASRQYTYKSVS